MSNFLKSFWGALTTIIVAFFLLTNIFSFMSSGIFWLEDEFHPVQYVKEATVDEVIDEKNFISDTNRFYISEEIYIKTMKEYCRERPYKLVTKYKDIELIIFGTLDYLKQRKCLEYNKAIQLHKENIIADEKEELEAEKQAKEIDILNNLECN